MFIGKFFLVFNYGYSTVHKVDEFGKIIPEIIFEGKWGECLMYAETH